MSDSDPWRYRFMVYDRNRGKVEERDIDGAKRHKRLHCSGCNAGACRHNDARNQWAESGIRSLNT